MTREKVIELKKANPLRTLASIGSECGISGERVRQILIAAHIPTERHLKWVCHTCGKPICFGSIHCRDCYNKSHRVTLVCAVCGKTFQRCLSECRARTKERGYKHPELSYCSQQCWGSVLGKTYGFKKRQKPYIYKRLPEVNEFSEYVEI
jgi:hypothetical protein